MRVLSISISLSLVSLAFIFCKQGVPDPKTNLVSIPLKAMDGTTQSLSDFKGKVVIVDFWATWCEPCAKAVPVINQWKTSVSDKEFVFVGINTDENEKLSKIKEHTELLKMSYPSLLDPDWKLTENYEVDGIPCVLVFDKNGHLVYRQAGLDSGDLPGLLIRSKVWVQ